MRIMMRKKIADSIIKKRQLRRITQQQLAELCHLSRKTISNMETCQGNVTLENYEKVMEILGLEVEVL